MTLCKYQLVISHKRFDMNLKSIEFGIALSGCGWEGIKIHILQTSFMDDPLQTVFREQQRTQYLNMNI